MDKKNKPMSPEQKNILIEYMRTHPQLKEKFTQHFTRQEYLALWKEASNILNATPGARKDWKEWRKSWQDIQSRAKVKKAQINAHHSRTGGGPPIPDLSSSDEKIAEIIGDTAISGLVGVRESEVEEILQMEMMEEENATISAIPHLFETNYTQNAEHDYARISSSNITMEKSQKQQVGNESKKKNLATQRLDTALDSTNKTSELLKQKVRIKEAYYKQKLILMERNVVATETLASELKEIKELIVSKINNL